jgi:transcriptional regulator with XRE-family HTH domain
MAVMARRKRTLSHQLRQAIKASDLSRYAICKATDIDQAAMSKFMKGTVGLSLAAVERLTDFLGLELVQRSDQEGR